MIMCRLCNMMHNACPSVHLAVTEQKLESPTHWMHTKPGRLPSHPHALNPAKRLEFIFDIPFTYARG